MWLALLPNIRQLRRQRPLTLLILQGGRPGIERLEECEVAAGCMEPIMASGAGRGDSVARSNLHALQDEAFGAGGGFLAVGEHVVQYIFKSHLVQPRQTINPGESTAGNKKHRNYTEWPNVGSVGLLLASQDLAALAKVSVRLGLDGVGLRCLEVLRSHIRLELVA